MARTHSDASPATANLPFRFLRAVGRGLFRLLFSIEVTGLDRIPASGPYILVCNHISWIDPLILMSQLPAEPRVHYIAAAEFTVNGPWPVPWIVRWVDGIIPVDRENHRGDRAVVVEALRVLKGGGVLGIFPEGRCGEHEGRIQPLKDGAASFAAKMKSPIQVVGLSGTLELCFRRRLRVAVGPLLEHGPDESHEELVARMAAAMAQTVPPVHPDQPKRPHMTWLARLF